MMTKVIFAIDHSIQKEKKRMKKGEKEGALPTEVTTRKQKARQYSLRRRLQGEGEVKRRKKRGERERGAFRPDRSRSGARSAVRAAIRARIVNYTGQIERNSCSDDAALTTLRSCDDQR